jgi:hypothetical protein
MRGLCKELKLGLQTAPVCKFVLDQLTPARLIPPGEWCLSAEAQAIWTRFQEDFKNFGTKHQRKMDRIDWWTELKELDFGPDDLLRRDMMDSTDAAAFPCARIWRLVFVSIALTAKTGERHFV